MLDEIETDEDAALALLEKARLERIEREHDEKHSRIMESINERFDYLREGITSDLDGKFAELRETLRAEIVTTAAVVAEEVAEETAEEVAEETAGETAEEVAEEVADDTAQETTEETVEEMTDTNEGNEHDEPDSTGAESTSEETTVEPDIPAEGSDDGTTTDRWSFFRKVW